MLMAVLGRRSREQVADQDVFASTAGGVKLSEPGLDLGVCLAVVSAIRELVSVGEIELKSDDDDED